MANFETLKASVDKNGEVMIRLDTGEQIELHKHNVKFDEATKEIVVDSGTQTSWIGADRVSYYWIHKEGFEKKQASSSTSQFYYSRWIFVGCSCNPGPNGLRISLNDNEKDLFDGNTYPLFRSTQDEGKPKVREFGNVKLSRVFGDITRTDKEVRVMVNVHVVQLPLHSLADDVAATKRAIDHIGGPIVLVGHSYGGFVITNTAYNNSKVLGLVYVAAFAPAQGQSLLNFVNPGKLPKGYLIFDNGGFFYVIECPRCHNIIFLYSEFNRLCYFCEECGFCLALST